MKINESTAASKKGALLCLCGARANLAALRSNGVGWAWLFKFAPGELRLARPSWRRKCLLGTQIESSKATCGVGSAASTEAALPCSSQKANEVS